MPIKISQLPGAGVALTNNNENNTYFPYIDLSISDENQRTRRVSLENLLDYIFGIPTNIFYVCKGKSWKK